MTALQQIDRDTGFLRFKEKAANGWFHVFSLAPFNLCLTKKARQACLEKKLLIAYREGVKHGIEIAHSDVTNFRLNGDAA